MSDDVPGEEPATSPPSDAASETVPSPEPAPTRKPARYREPGEFEGELARVSFEIRDGVPTSTVAVGPGRLSRDRDAEVVGQCRGRTYVNYEMTVGDHSTITGRIRCDRRADAGRELLSLGRAGTVQITVDEAERLTRAWVAVVER